MMKAKLILALLLLSVLASAASAQTGLVCGDPLDKGCLPQYDGFEANDLTFLTGRAQLGTGTRHQSEEFYAVMLQSVKAASNKNRLGCDFVSDAQRLSAQKLFPHNKVFTSRNACVGMTIVVYDNVDNNFNFMAVYGGSTEDQARVILQKARRRYPTANIRRIRVILDFADE